MLIGLPVYCLPALPGTASDEVGCAGICCAAAASDGAFSALSSFSAFSGCCAAAAACTRLRGGCPDCDVLAARAGGFDTIGLAAGAASATVSSAVIGSGGVIDAALAIACDIGMTSSVSTAEGGATRADGGATSTSLPDLRPSNTTARSRPPGP